MSTLISPIDGVLVDRRRPLHDFDGALTDPGARSLRVSDAVVADLAMLGNGAYSPLTGFMSQDDYSSVVEGARLAGGTAWTLPITLPLSTDQAHGLSAGDVVALRDDRDAFVGTITVRDVFTRDARVEAREVYRTEDAAHPGVRALFAQGNLLVGGDVDVVQTADADDVLTPAQTRAEFTRRGWSTVVAFQTRNPIHRAHEYLTKVALEQIDGLLLHPLSGATKDDDVPLDVRVRCYQVLLENYYPRERTVLSLFPATMRYAGPREAIYHGLVRRNYGCSHFIIGRDAAGVGSYYGTYDAQALYDELGGAERLGFTALKFEHSFYCNACQGMASTRTCPHGNEDRLVLSGTAVREMLTRGEELPAEFTRPEVAAVLREAYARVGAPAAG
ncbi:MAG TPA: sulfate adenylyltransferase [Candidatus Dormibacteraeota bacterium]|nr:sulfate adenylyltransferase [Candidatus Dormibacteraeota bacterium]